MIPTGLDFGTVTIMMPTEKGTIPVEHTTFRRELYKDDRHPEVTFTKSIEEDLMRRDFTINAMAMDSRGNIIDPYGGLEDIKKGIIRAVGDPQERFREDPLRIMRMARFASRYDFNIDEDTFRAAKEMVKEMPKRVAVERVMQELLKGIKQSKKPSRYFEILKDVGVLDIYMPELKGMIGVEQDRTHYGDVWEHTMSVVDNARRMTDDEVVLMAALLHDVGKPRTRKFKKDGQPIFPGHPEVGAEMARKILKRLRFSNKFIDDVATLVKHHDLTMHNNKKVILRKLADLTSGGKRPEMLDKLEILVKADALAHREEYARIFIKDAEEKLRKIRQWMKEYPLDRRQLAINGKDLLKAGVDQYKIGKIMDKLLEEVWEDRLKNDKEELMRRALQLAKSMGALKGSGKTEITGEEKQRGHNGYSA
ncbi:CCA tRNA nucleotidyltransferase [Pyrococcus kukulkanii]|uniref:HD domain-containing protein n=1 Tax=Pyrococcus kukulkanii TaxID=1609559 RepID=A0ABV4T9D7_9EURY